MARINLSLVFLSILYIACMTESASVRYSTSTDFIKASCKATRYPNLCIQTLLMYEKTIQRSPQRLVQSALSVSLTKTRSATTFVSKVMKTKGMKPRVYKAVKDCADNMGDSVDWLSQSIQELGHVSQAGGRNFVWHMSNVQTWVSAALTDGNTCIDGFEDHSMDGLVKAAIRGKIISVIQVTSNALALINQLKDAKKL